MIISASRRTDIPAFYAEWFVERTRAGFCTVPNPFNRAQVSVISLRPEDVAAIVFWTRNPRPLFPHLDELDRRGYRYYFQYTILDYPRALEAGTPPLEAALRTFCELSARIGPERVIWRYDPIVLSPATDVAFHLARYAEIARRLHGRTRRSVISVMDWYRKIERRMQAAAEQGIPVPAGAVTSWPGFDDLMWGLAALAAAHEMEIVSCAEEIDLTRFGIAPGKCVDDELIRRLFGIEVEERKDSSQRPACGCVVSRDIGMYDSCLFGCQYCYATTSFQAARRHHAEHDPHSPSLLSHALVSEPTT
jgi:hypothetical protein